MSRAAVVAACLAVSAALASAADADQPAPATTTSPAASPAPDAQAPDRRPGSEPGASTAPGAAVAASPAPLVVTGTLRAYDFNRINTPDYQGSNPNREAFNFGGDLRLEHAFARSGFMLGGAYWGAFPFGTNGSPAITQNNTKNGGIDNSLPGYSLSTYELYLRYADRRAKATIGYQLLNTAWEPSSDSRIKPSLYDAADLSYTIGHFTPYVTRGIQFENRTSSLYDQSTLVTSGTTQPIPGFLRYGLTWNPDKRTSISVENNDFYNIASLVYASGKYAFAPTSKYAPFVAAQFVDEQKNGRAYLGGIDDQTYGIQVGVTPVKNVALTLAGDTSPWHYATFTAASLAAATTAAGKAYYLPTGTTSQYANPAGGYATVGSNGGNSYTAAYGGIVSPYSDSYATDPIYTTSLTQGAVDRRSAGTSVKVAATYTSNSKQFVALASEAYSIYDTTFARNRTSEFDADLTYDFNRVRTGPYKGFSIRERLGVRQQPYFAGSAPGHFAYVRHQLQYTF